MLALSSLLLGRFRIEKVLGYGGFAVTYLAVDEFLQKPFAIKEYFPSDFAVAEGTQIQARPGREMEFDWGLKRFLDEARILARFHHPNIVGVSEIFEANDTAYIVLEYQSGISFKAWLDQIDSAPTQNEMDLILSPLLDALELLHRNEVVHRDIAPDNIYIRDDGSPVLLDFGSARSDIMTKTKTVTATIKDGFSPIEQYSNRGDRQGPWTDIYSIASTIYFAVTKSKPHPATDRIVSDAMPSIHEIAHGAFRTGFLEAVDWGLSVRPEDRPQCVKEWRDLLFSINSVGRKNAPPKHTKGENKNLFYQSRLLKVAAVALFIPIGISASLFYSHTNSQSNYQQAIGLNAGRDFSSVLGVDEFTMASHYREGTAGYRKNELEALKLYRAAAEKGNPQARTVVVEFESVVAKNMLMSAATIRSRMQQSARMTDNFYKTLALARTLSSPPIDGAPSSEQIILKLQSSVSTGKSEITEFGHTYVELLHQLQGNFSRKSLLSQGEELEKDLARTGGNNLRSQVASVLSELEEIIEKQMLDPQSIIVRAIDGSRPWLE